MVPGFSFDAFSTQISVRNLRKLDCYPNRCPLRSKTLRQTDAARAPGSLVRRVVAFSYSLEPGAATALAAARRACTEVVFGGGSPGHNANTALPRNHPIGTAVPAQPKPGPSVDPDCVQQGDPQMNNPTQKPGQQNQNPGQKPGQQQGGGQQKPGQQQQNPGQQQNPDRGR